MFIELLKYTVCLRENQCCFIPYPGIAKIVMEYISVKGVAGEENVINFRAKHYDFLFCGSHEFSRQCVHRAAP